MNNIHKIIPKLTIKSGPLDKEWPNRLVEEYKSLLSLVKNMKSQNNDWFQIEPNEDGTEWKGICWAFVEDQKWTFNVVIKLPVGYPTAPPDILIPELDGKTVKMYKGGQICTTVHFAPLWSRNVPHYGIAHALMFGLSTWLNVEVPNLISTGILKKELKSN